MESLIRATIAKNLEIGRIEQYSPLEKVIAMGSAGDVLGRYIIHAMAGDTKARLEACKIVGKIMARDCNRAKISSGSVAYVVFCDIYDIKCKTCKGRGIIYDGNPRTCHSCHGSALRNTRITAKLVDGKRIPDKIYRKTYSIFNDHIKDITNTVRNKLK